MSPDLHDARRDYAGDAMPETVHEPWTLIEHWFAQARAEQESGRLEEASAMVLSTADAHGRPSSRVVLAKALGPGLGSTGGIDFYTSAGSRKGQDLAANAHASVLFFWPSLNRQLRVEGRVEIKPVDEAEAYFARRPLASQVAAHVSQQSRPRESRAALETEFAQAMERFTQGTVPRPDDWLGYRVHAERVEFWQGMPGRLHDRIVCDWDGQAWRCERVDP